MLIKNNCLKKQKNQLILRTHHIASVEIVNSASEGNRHCNSVAPQQRRRLAPSLQEMACQSGNYVRGRAVQSRDEQNLQEPAYLEVYN